MSYGADRVSRVKLVVLSGVLAGSFSLATGLAMSTAFLGLGCRTLPRQMTKAKVAGKVINLMTALGMPMSRRIA